MSTNVPLRVSNVCKKVRRNIVVCRIHDFYSDEILSHILDLTLACWLLAFGVYQYCGEYFMTREISLWYNANCTSIQVLFKDEISVCFKIFIVIQLYVVMNHAFGFDILQNTIDILWAVCARCKLNRHVHLYVLLSLIISGYSFTLNKRNDFSFRVAPSWIWRYVHRSVTVSFKDSYVRCMKWEVSLQAVWTRRAEIVLPLTGLQKLWSWYKVRSSWPPSDKEKMRRDAEICFFPLTVYSNGSGELAAREVLFSFDLYIE